MRRISREAGGVIGGVRPLQTRSDRGALSYILPVALGLALSTPLAYAQPRPADDQTVTVAIAGDLIGPVHPMNRAADPQFAKLAALFQKADAGFANQENNVFDITQFAGYPGAESGGAHPLRRVLHARELKDMGVSIVSTANNHSGDYGPEGVVETLKTLSAAGIITAGTGLDEPSARAPGYLSTPNGTVALVATASTFPPVSVAGEAVEVQDTKSKPRPGISALHVRNVRILPPVILAQVRNAAGPFATAEGSGVRISDQLFKLGEVVGSHWEIDPTDESAELGAVKAARSHADVVLFSIHAHETAGNVDPEPPLPYEPMVLHKANEAPSPNDPRPTNFEIELFHSVVDSGADSVIRTGPHIVSGIEIYKGKPIFYGLGSFFLDFGGDRTLYTPVGDKIIVPDSWFVSFVPVCAFKAHRLQSIKLYPIIIESNAGPTSGMPRLANGPKARVILQTLINLSKPFGTKIDILGDVATVEIPASKT